jgi:glucose/arabinose dehydrogenase
MSKLKSSQKILRIAIVIVVLFVALTLAAIFQNTNLLRWHIPSEDIVGNNDNPPTVDENYSDLEPQTLFVASGAKIGIFATDHTLMLPKGFQISLIASGLSKPRFFDLDDTGRIFIAEQGRGAVSFLDDHDGDGFAENIVTLDTGLRNAHSLDWFEGDLYVGAENQIVVYRGVTSTGSVHYRKKEILISDLPSGEGHVTRTVLIGPDRKLYVSMGSSCNVCDERDERRAAVVRYNLDGTGEEIFATGLRNSVGLYFAPNGELWGTDNGRDLIGDDLPPDEVNVIEMGKNYGWPYCYGKKVTDKTFGSRESFCADTTESRIDLQAHSAALGITQVPKLTWPKSLRGSLVLAFHGSWNRTTPTGYKVMRIDPLKEHHEAINLVSGWLDASGRNWGRPVGVGFDHVGNLLISDDKAGALYRVTYTPSK